MRALRLRLPKTGSVDIPWAIRRDPDGSRKHEMARRKYAGWRTPTRILRWALLALCLIPALLVLCLRWFDPWVTSFMLRDLTLALVEGREDHAFRYRWADWEKISSHAKLAVVASEDQKFPRHFGFDLDAIAHVWRGNRDSGRLRGASTISQQLAKNLFLWPGKSYVRKGLEAYLTILIEALLPKRRILEVYLNVVQFGGGVFGIRAASETYFGKPPVMLSAREAALLAAVLPNPERYRAAPRPSPHVQARQAWILRQMTRLGGSAYLAQL
ncbi:MAG: monofunctional biosynthetic peptidoglycan transglycosylase [Burkholderiales bacterium]